MKMLLALAALFAVPASAQEAACNDEMVVQLVRAGIATDLIAAQISQCSPHFQLDPSHLIALKQAGVSDELVRTMARRQNGGSLATTRPASSIPPAPVDAKGGLPEDEGVYWIGQGGELFRIEGVAVSNLRTGSTLASKMTMGIKRARINAQIKGSHADLRVGSHQPEFYFYLPEGASIGDYLMLKLAQRDDVRQVEVGEATFWKRQEGVDHLKEVDFSYQRVKNRLYRLTPKSEMPSGEFGFYVASGVELTKPTGRIYDFGID